MATIFVKNTADRVTEKGNFPLNAPLFLYVSNCGVDEELGNKLSPDLLSVQEVRDTVKHLHKELDRCEKEAIKILKEKKNEVKTAVHTVPG